MYLQRRHRTPILMGFPRLYHLHQRPCLLMLFQRRLRPQNHRRHQTQRRLRLHRYRHYQTETQHRPPQPYPMRRTRHYPHLM